MPRFSAHRVPAHKRFRLSGIDPSPPDPRAGEEEVLRTRLDTLAGRLDELQNLLYAQAQRRVLLVLQGLDTSGKDGSIRAVFARTSPLGIRVQAFKAPSELERAHDFLWRCHAVVPRAGEIGVWNRSHYEDVLVPVVEGWIDKAETKRRYAHINDFERLLVETGTVVLKCMLHISKDEQRKRLQARIDQPEKRWKYSMDDLAVRARWDDYQRAYDRLFEATSTPQAPWYVVPANNKLLRNIMIAGLLVQALEGMKLVAPAGDPAMQGLVVK